MNRPHITHELNYDRLTYVTYKKREVGVAPHAALRWRGYGDGTATTRPHVRLHCTQDKRLRRRYISPASSAETWKVLQFSLLFIISYK